MSDEETTKAPKKTGVPANFKNYAGKRTANLRRGGAKKQPPKTSLSADQELFAAKRACGISVEGAAAEMGCSLSSVWAWNRKKLVKARVEELKIELKKKIVQRELNGYVLSLSHLDTQTARIASVRKPHRFRGFSDTVEAIELGYRRLKAIEPKSITRINATAQAAAGATTFKDVYRAKWLVEKEQKMLQEIQAEQSTVIDQQAKYDKP